jgi:hypothetical protein
MPKPLSSDQVASGEKGMQQQDCGSVLNRSETSQKDGVVFVEFQTRPSLLMQISEVPDKEVLEEAQRPRLATSDCLQQGQECVRAPVLQHC